MESNTALEVVNAVTKATLKNLSIYILQISQELVNTCPSQGESLLQPHQNRAQGVLINDCPTQHKMINNINGTQCIQVVDTILPLHFDGLKYYFQLPMPVPSDIGNYPCIHTLN